MRIFVVAMIALLCAAPASADPIAFHYTFTGAFVSDFGAGPVAQLNLGNGWVDLSGHTFTVSGTIGDVCCEGRGLATMPVWDFGALGSFATDNYDDAFVYRQQHLTFHGVEGDLISVELWYPFTIDFQGLNVFVAPGVLGADESVMVPIDTTAISRTQSGRYLDLNNGFGEELVLSERSPFTGTIMTINSVRIDNAPEPATLALMGLGAALLYRRHPR